METLLDKVYYPVLIVLVIFVNIFCLVKKQVEIDVTTASTIIRTPRINEVFKMKETKGVILFKNFEPIPPRSVNAWEKRFESLSTSNAYKLISAETLVDYSGDRDMFYIAFIATMVISILVTVSYSIGRANNTHPYKAKIFSYIEFIAAAIVLIIAITGPWLYGNWQFWISYAFWYLLLASLIHVIKIGSVNYFLSRKNFA